MRLLAHDPWISRLHFYTHIAKDINLKVINMEAKKTTTPAVTVTTDSVHLKMLRKWPWNALLWRRTAR
jgi:hypothetical protein